MLSSLLRRPKPARDSKNSPTWTRPSLTALEDRVVPYSPYGIEWANTNISVSYMPDGTQLDGGRSELFAELNAIAPTATWQREIARALQTWAQYAPINFHFVPDDGSPKATIGLTQGNSGFGDIRFEAHAGSGYLAYAYGPNVETVGYTDGGDVSFNSNYTFSIGSTPDLYSVALHELGHSLGLGHSTSGTVMYASYTGVKYDLASDDIAGIQYIYGVRTHDAYDAAGSNNSIGTATTLSLPSGGVNIPADLTSRSDVDYYRVVASGSSLTATVDARNLSLLAPKVLVYDAAGNLLGSATADYGQAATLNLSGLTQGQSYYVVADGATADVFGMGAYLLNAQFGDGGSPVTAPQSPGGLVAVAATSAQVDLSWQDNSGNEDGFRVEKSTDGVNFTPAGTAGANATNYTVTGLEAGATYSFRVLAYNGGGASGWSNTAQATTPPAPPPTEPPPTVPPPPTLAADRFETNDTASAAKNLGKFNTTSQTALTIHSATDVDWFTFTVNSSASFTVSISFTQAAGNLDLYVYNTQQQMMAAGTSVTANDAVTISLAGGKLYYVKVVSPDGGVNTYDLAVTRSGGKGGKGGANLVLDTHGPDSQTTGDALAPGGTLPGFGCPLGTGASVTAPVVDGETGPPSGRPASPGRKAESPDYLWSQSLQQLRELDLPFRDGIADLPGLARGLV